MKAAAQLKSSFANVKRLNAMTDVDHMRRRERFKKPSFDSCDVVVVIAVVCSERNDLHGREGDFVLRNS
jgi:hypothetical protein